jgi:hypothetical protein
MGSEGSVQRTNARKVLLKQCGACFARAARFEWPIQRAQTCNECNTLAPGICATRWAAKQTYSRFERLLNESPRLCRGMVTCRPIMIAEDPHRSAIYEQKFTFN